MTEDEPEPEISEAELDAQIARSGLQLSPGERSNVLTTARYLQRAIATYPPYAEQAAGDDDLRSLRDDPRFAALVRDAVKK